MKTITLWLMQYQLKKVTKLAKNENHSIVKKAMLHRIEIYKSTILFLK